MILVPVVIGGVALATAGGAYLAKRKKQRSLNAKLFGRTLNEFSLETLDNNTGIPKLVERMLSSIEQRALQTVDIFRDPGFPDHQKELAEKIEGPKTAKKIDFDTENPHDVTGLIKQFLRELPECLLTTKIYPKLVEIQKIHYHNAHEWNSSVKNELLQLPLRNFRLLRRLTQVLWKISQYEQQNQMSPQALSVIIGPCIMYSEQIEEAEQLFQNAQVITDLIQNIIINLNQLFGGGEEPMDDHKDEKKDSKFSSFRKRLGGSHKEKSEQDMSPNPS